MWPHFSRVLVEGIVWASVGIGVALDQGRTGILDLLVWGAQMNVDLSGYPSDIRAEAEAVIGRSKAYQSKRPAPAEQDGLLRMVHQAWVTYERRLVATARTAEAEVAALAYVTDLRPCYEWEGYSDCPAREAAFAADYQTAHPTGPFSQFLPLLEAHRWLCAAEGFDYEKNVTGTSLPAPRVTRVLSELVALHGRPDAIRVDNGPELLAQVFVDWCAARGIGIHYIQPGKPDQNAYIERFNRTYREEVLDAYLFESLEEVRAVSERWLLTYNHERPHDSLGAVPPLTFLPRPSSPGQSPYRLST